MKFVTFTELVTKNPIKVVPQEVVLLLVNKYKPVIKEGAFRDTYGSEITGTIIELRNQREIFVSESIEEVEKILSNV